MYLTYIYVIICLHIYLYNLDFNKYYIITSKNCFRSENKSFVNTTCPVKQMDIEKELKMQTSSEAITQTDDAQCVETSVIPDLIASTRHVDESNLDWKVNNTEATLKAPIENTNSSPPLRKLQRSSTARKPSERRVNFSERSVSQDIDASHSTPTSSDLRLPPILLPIISSLENVKLSENSEPVLKRWESISSVEPVGDSSISSLPSSTSDSEEEVNKRQFRRCPTVLRRRENFSTMRSKSVCDPESRKIKSTKNSDNSENASNISCNTNNGSIGASSTSGSDNNSKILKRQSSLNSRLSNRNIRSATITRRNERASSAHRASTARSKPIKQTNLANLKSSEPVSKAIPVSKDREQGVDYLVEVSDGLVSAWGAGAVRRLAREWEWERARTVTRAAFHYVHFNAVAQSLPELKAK